MNLSSTAWLLRRRALLMAVLLSPIVPGASSVGLATNAGRDKPPFYQGTGKPLESAPQQIPSKLRNPDLPTDVRKSLFVRTVLPLVVSENERLRSRRSRMLSLLDALQGGDSLSPQEQSWLRSLADTYRVQGDPVTEAEAQGTLRLRVDVVPAGLVLAQAALESGWGRSKYTHRQRDLFGMTALEPSRSKGRKFGTLRESVRTYMRTLNSHGAYKRFRVMRARLREKGQPLDGYRLAGGLANYSTLGDGYVRKVRALIRSNDLDRVAATEPVSAEGVS
jgi:Bax protein